MHAKPTLNDVNTLKLSFQIKILSYIVDLISYTFYFVFKQFNPYYFIFFSFIHLFSYSSFIKLGEQILGMMSSRLVAEELAVLISYLYPLSKQ